MTGILAALRQGRFTCYGRAGVDGVGFSPTPDDSDARPPRGKFLEDPRPGSRFLEVPTIADSDPLLFRYFIDGSERVTNAGYVVDTKRRYLPLLIAQNGRRNHGTEGLTPAHQALRRQQHPVFPRLVLRRGSSRRRNCCLQRRSNLPAPETILEQLAEFDGVDPKHRDSPL